MSGARAVARLMVVARLGGVGQDGEDLDHGGLLEGFGWSRGVVR
ncbi:hypothetical protein ACWGLG_17695 [Streptomyces antimycoticus]